MRRAPVSFPQHSVDSRAPNLCREPTHCRRLRTDSAEGQVEPIPDPFIEAIVSGKEGPLPAGVQEIQGKTFRIESASRFSGRHPGCGRSESRTLFYGGRPAEWGCAVTDFQLGAASESSRGNVLPSNSSQMMSRGGFTVAPGQRIPQSVSVKFRGGLIFYYLLFSAAKGVIE